MPEDELPCNLARNIDAYTLREAGRIVVCPNVVYNFRATLAQSMGPTTAGIDAIARALSMILFHEFLHFLFDDFSRYNFYAFYID